MHMCMCYKLVLCRVLIVGPYEEVIAADGTVEEYFAFDATSVGHKIIWSLLTELFIVEVMSYWVHLMVRDVELTNEGVFLPSLQMLV